MLVYNLLLMRSSWISSSALSAFFLVCTCTLFAQHINLVPQPKEIRASGKPFRITAATRIAVSPAHIREDRFIAETLADEIENATHHRPRIVSSASSAAGSSTIFLTRMSDALSKRKLQSNGLTADTNFNDEGYLLNTSATGITVAGQSAAGLFYGVQTLRQLVQSVDNRPIIPAVSIKDWPTMRWRGVHDDVSRGPIPTVEYMK